MGIDKILIVDDDFAFVNRLKNGLQQFGQFVILTAPDGKHALRLLTTQKVSLVVTDIDMPKLDGLELLAAMTRQFPNVLSIVATSLKQRVLPKNTKGDSLFSYLNKPFDHVQLHSEIIKVLDCRDEIHFKAGIYPSSMLPLVHVSGKTCLLEVQTGGGKTGLFYFNHGMLCDASHDNLAGREAVDEMLAWAPGKYWFKSLPRSHSASRDNAELTALIMQGTGVHPLGKQRQEKNAVSKPSQTKPKKQEKSKLPQNEPEQQEISKSSQTEPEQQNIEKQISKSPLPFPRCKVLIVDDSNLMRHALIEVLSTDKTLEIVGEATNGKEALELIKQKRPDVVTLDLNMPVMDGLTTLKHMMILSPTPTIILSSIAIEGTSITFDTLKYGAVDFMAAPSNIINPEISKQLHEIIHKIHLAAAVKIESAKYIRSVTAEKKSAPEDRVESRRVVCMGAGEGGYAGLLKIIPKLSLESPVAYFIVLHTIPQHVDAFINYLDQHSAASIRRAENGLTAEGATCYLASGKEHMSIQLENSGKIIMQVNPAPFGPNGNSINILMCSMAEQFKQKSIGIILSGSGDDGTEGFKEIQRVGGTTLIQNPANCLHKEMTENARKYTGKNHILPESKIAETVNTICMQDL